MAELWKNYQERLASGIPFFQLFRELIAEVGKQSSPETRRFLERILEGKGNETISDVEAAEKSNEIPFWGYLACKAAYCVKLDQLLQGHKYAIIAYRLVKSEEMDALQELIAEESYQRLHRELTMSNEKTARLIADQKNESSADRAKLIFEEVLLARWESDRPEDSISVPRVLEEELGLKEYRKIIEAGCDVVQGNPDLGKRLKGLKLEANFLADREKAVAKKQGWKFWRR